MKTFKEYVVEYLTPDGEDTEYNTHISIINSPNVSPETLKYLKAKAKDVRIRQAAKDALKRIGV